MEFKLIYCKKCGAISRIANYDLEKWNIIKEKKELIFEDKKMVDEFEHYRHNHPDILMRRSVCSPNKKWENDFYFLLAEEGIAKHKQEITITKKDNGYEYLFRDTIALNDENALFTTTYGHHENKSNRLEEVLYNDYLLSEEEYCCCPVCSEKLTKNNSIYCSEFAEVNVDSNGKIMIPNKLESHNTLDSRYKSDYVSYSMFKSFCEVIEQREKRREVNLMVESQNFQRNYRFAKQSVTNESLVNYLEKLVQLELELHYCNERYYVLQINKLKFDKEYVKARANLLKQEEEGLKSERLRLNQELDGLDGKYSTICFDYDFSKFGLIKPLKPEYPKKEKPTEPILKKSNIFNKNRVNKENNQLMSNYYAKLEEYNSLVEKYNYDLTIYEKEYKDYCEQCEKIEAIEKDRIKLENSLLEKKKKEEETTILLKIQSITDSLDNLTQIIDSDNRLIVVKKKVELIESEAQDMLQLINRINECRSEYYGKCLVHSKYCNIVALSTIYEYLITGRCDKLTGSDGAYNLYENEIRTNRIIGQLDKVIDSLEVIKENQYYTYQILSSLEAKLSSINSKMEKAVTSLDKISASTLETASLVNNINENVEMIAYNAEKTAYYSKINAQLTDSLGFMMAFK